MQRRWLGLVGLLGAILIGCDTTQEAAKPRSSSQEAVKPTSSSAVVTGTVTYRERIAMPPKAVVVVKLEDVSLQDAPAKLIGEQRIEFGEKQVPIPFELHYDQATIDPKHTYNLSARIVLGPAVLLISDTAYPVITNGNPNSAEIVVQAAKAPPSKSP